MVCDQGKFLRFLHSQNAAHRGQIQTVLFFVGIPAAVSPSMDPAPAGDVFFSLFRIENIAAFLFDAFVSVDRVHTA